MQDLRRHADLRFSGGAFHKVGDQGVDPLGVLAAEHVGDLGGDVFVFQNTGPHCVVNVVVDIGDPIGVADDLTLQALGDLGAAVAKDPASDLIGQIQPLSVLFELVHHAQGLFVVVERNSHHLGEGRFTGVSERRVAEVVTHCSGLRQILIQTQTAGDRSGDPRDLKGVGHTGAVMVALRLQKNLRFVHQAAEGSAVENAVCVALIAGSVLGLRFRTAATPGLRSKRSPGGKIFSLTAFEFFPNAHCYHHRYDTIKKWKIL